MEKTYLDRLMEPELIFGLAVRFFGVFAVLIILMAFMYLSGWLFTRYKERMDQQGPAGPSPAPGPGPAKKSPRPGKRLRPPLS
jgi:Na+-transporting methylmalonyl-CoA/oxaloacetate decarboxylase gamma subunit